MRAMFNDDNVKGSFFLATLPDTMDNVIDNLATRQLTAFQDIEPKILDISEKHSLDTTNSLSAYATRQTAARQQNAHVYTNCNELRKHKEQQKKMPSKGKDAAGKRNKRQKGNSAKVVNNEVDDDDDDDSSTTEVNGFAANVVNLTTPLLTPTASPPQINANGK
ncbi:uncharacterized protein CC84DRAFT_1217753 [Paraphaeosphaeria sporulosa]|uniref:Uncharacterized protein n=1 Tax=Paraphaeosphaeria sporulosa TaxID=1460663 RepID=A0A177CI70_9PLEO|nr:uncharacterized protein CC84DRAFT_1217753 [Paraphaeosphaeria sporulosa]OAG06549.1 hypothetical protein CC84DRAFT_1217753 [Paraphaeosphaeria sporulosa]